MNADCFFERFCLWCANVVLAFAAASCCFMETEVAEIRIPHELDGSDSRATAIVPNHWLFYVADGTGQPQAQTVQNGARISVSFSKNAYTALLAVPCALDGTVLAKPYGIIYPVGTTLTQKDGFAADVLRTMYVASTSGSQVQRQTFLAHFNWRKFMETCRTYEDPWMLDKPRILEAIAEGRLKKSDIVLEK